MKLSTMVVNTIEMTQNEENCLWRIAHEPFKVLGKEVIRWDTHDGNNCMLLEGEKTFRQIVIIPE